MSMRTAVIFADPGMNKYMYMAVGHSILTTKPCKIRGGVLSHKIQNISITNMSIMPFFLLKLDSLKLN